MAKTHFFWGRGLGPWKVWGLWYRQKVFIGVSMIVEGEWEISERDLR
jgi:hypothetical protein